MKKIKDIVFALLISFGVCYLPKFISEMNISDVMMLVGSFAGATFIENRWSNNKGIFRVIEIIRDVLGGLGSLVILNQLPIKLPEIFPIFVTFAATIILAITMSDDVMSNNKKQ